MYPREACIHHLFEEYVRLTPDAVALQIDGDELTYQELDEASNKVAHDLRELGVCTETVVGICLPRSLSLIVGLLGILKAGGAYVALDESDPNRYLASIIHDTQMPVLLTRKHLLGLLPYDSGHGVYLDSRGAVTTIVDCNVHAQKREELQRTQHNLSRGPTALNLAYVAYTSGSTGPPKGVCITHRGVVRLVKNTNYASLTAEEVFLHWSPLSFDASTFEIWACLLNGARLVIFPPERMSIALLRDLIRWKGVTTLWLTAGLFHRIVEQDVDALQGVRQLLVGGDVLSVPLVHTTIERLKNCQLINAYGPTEGTTFTCCYSVGLPLPNTNSIPIGRPVSNSFVYVLNPDRERVMFGEPGELAIGGDGLARGYLNLSALTSKKFISAPFGSDPDLRIYLTGDRVRYLPDGNLDFLGRMDRQVKIRGFRVELTAIESILGKHSGVSEAVVIAQGLAEHKRLEAYIVPKSDSPSSEASLRKFLGDQLPKYMLPTFFYYVNEMPLIPNGKVDYHALRELKKVRKVGEDKGIGLPQTRTEKALAQLWCETLGLNEASIDQEFFELGGDSLQLVDVAVSVERKLGKKLPLADLARGTIRSLSITLDDMSPPTAVPGGSVVLLSSGIGVLGCKPLFFVSGQAGDDLGCYLHVVANLPEQQTVYGLQAPGLTIGQEFETIEQTAAYHIQALRAVQPSGPYFLSGFCFGGLLAFEMAQQLQALGERVDFLAILDYRHPGDRQPEFRWTPGGIFQFTRNAGYAAADFLEVPEERQACVRRSISKVEKYCTQIWRRGDSRSVEIDESLPCEIYIQCSRYTEEKLTRLRTQYRAWRRYRPRTYSGPVSLFRTRRLPLLQPYDETLGWSKIAVGPLDVQKLSVPGFQGSMLRPRFAWKLAERLSRSLKLAQGGEFIRRMEAGPVRS